jgi:hypothetical protein
MYVAEKLLSGVISGAGSEALTSVLTSLGIGGQASTEAMLH